MRQNIFFMIVKKAIEVVVWRRKIEVVFHFQKQIEVVFLVLLKYGCLPLICLVSNWNFPIGVVGWPPLIQDTWWKCLDSWLFCLPAEKPILGQQVTRISTGVDRGLLTLAPHQHQRKFFTACVCKVAFKHLPQPIRSFGTLGQLLNIPPLKIA